MRLSFTPKGLELAYKNAVFPMGDSDTGELYWCRPPWRGIIPLDGFHVSRSLARLLRQKRFQITYNQDFLGVMRGCADREEGTWITPEFFEVYGQMHWQGSAHSVEVYYQGRLVGGTYGVAFGSAFMAESMFHYETNASKIALWGLVERLKERGFTLLDTQYLTPHLASLGGIEISDTQYCLMLLKALKNERRFADDV